MPLAVLVLTAALSTGLAAIATWRLRTSSRMLRTGPRTTGTIVDVRRTRRQSGYTYQPTVRFRTLDGRDVTAVLSGWGQAPLASTPPSTVTVCYDEAKPTRILLPDVGPTSGRSSIVAAAVIQWTAAAAVLVAGIVVYLYLE